MPKRERTGRKHAPRPKAKSAKPARLRPAPEPGANRGRWARGQSGNPAGRPKGALNRSTLAAQALLEGEAEKLTRKAVKLALAGDVAALRLVLERLVPPMRERPVNIDLPKLEKPSDLPAALAAVAQALASGQLLPAECDRLVATIGAWADALGVRDFLERLEALEEERKSRLAEGQA